MLLGFSCQRRVRNEVLSHPQHPKTYQQVFILGKWRLHCSTPVRNAHCLAPLDVRRESAHVSGKAAHPFPVPGCTRFSRNLCSPQLGSTVLGFTEESSPIPNGKIPELSLPGLRPFSYIQVGFSTEELTPEQRLMYL